MTKTWPPLNCIALMFFCIVFSQTKDNFPPPENSAVIEVSEVESKILLDGKLDEVDWEKANEISDFLNENLDKGEIFAIKRKWSFYMMKNISMWVLGVKTRLELKEFVYKI